MAHDNPGEGNKKSNVIQFERSARRKNVCGKHGQAVDREERLRLHFDRLKLIRELFNAEACRILDE